MAEVSGPSNPLAEQCLEAYSKAIKIGMKTLLSDLKNAKAYNHDSPSGKYGDKNTYFNRANIVGYPFLARNLTCLSKDYYWQMFNAITSFEKRKKTSLNKGMVCANFGVSDLAEGHIDGGIAHLLWASHEDRGWRKTSDVHNIFQSPLYTQFAQGEKRNGTSQFGGPAPHIMLERAIHSFNKIFKTSLSKEDIFRELANDDDHRAMLEGALWILARNLPIFHEEAEKIFLSRKQKKHNIYTRIRLFNGLIDLCRFVELRMRHYEKPPKNVRTLGNLIHYTFDNETWFRKEVKPRYRRPKRGQEFDDFVKKTLRLKAPISNVLFLWVTRNYFVHIGDVETPYFFENLDKVFQSIVGCYLFYLRLRSIL